MTPDHDNQFGHLEPIHQVENLASVSDRVVRKKDQDKQQKQKKKRKRPDIEQQRAEELEKEEQQHCSEEGHIDFRA